MRHRMLALAGAIACLAPAPAGARAERAPNLLPADGFEHGVGEWRPLQGARTRLVNRAARTGGRALRVVLTAASRSGAYSAIPRDRLQDAGLVGTVTGALQGRLTASAWVRGLGRPRGRVRLQLNETGGAHEDEVLGRSGVRTVTLTRRWRRLVVYGSPRRVDRTGAAVLVTAAGDVRGDIFLLDDVFVSGEPPAGNPADATSARWPWWAYVLVWTAVLGSGTLWLARRRKPLGPRRT